MKLVLTLLLLGVAAVHSQIIFTACPGGWFLYEGNQHCYRFMGYPRYRPDGASKFCANDGAALLSINSLQEHAYITNWLETRDGSRDTWLTSGVVIKEPEGVQWLGDGTSSTDLSFWHDAFTPVLRKSGDIVTYDFTDGVQYKWAIGDPGKNSSFICEIPLEDIYKIVEERRDYDYGLTLDNPELAPRGPKFLVEPVDTTILSKTTLAYMDCLADGRPKPTYTWLRGDGTNMAELATGADLRFSMTGGRLMIEDPVDADEGTYQCAATNEFGTILSSPVVLSFGMLGEFSNVATAAVDGRVGEGAVLVCPAITARPGVSYQWFKENPRTYAPIFLRPEFQPHTFISNNGKLYFSELAPTDDDTYQCSVILTATGGTGTYLGASRAESKVSLGFELRVTTGASSNIMPVIQDDFIKVYPGNPKRGQTIQMECFAYGTSPLYYRWFRFGKEMPRSAVITLNGRVLTISDVQIEDSGLYGCRVDSRKTQAFDAKNYTLNVQSEPYFSYPLTNQHVDVGGRLTWHCEARGKPAPTYTWYKNGQRLQNSTGVAVVGNTVVIERLQKDRDNGMYQCAAKNLYGSTFSSAQIRVLEFKPSFEKHPVDDSLSAAVGGNITIVCDPEAAPAPTYQWLRNGADLGLTQGGAGSNGFQMLLNGNLFIENINNGHQGSYTCHVKNILGEASSTGVLRVFPSVVISEKPQNVQELVNETASFICTASAPAGVDVVYIWKFNNHLINFEHFVEYRKGSGPTKGNLFIVGVQYKHEGVYSCQVTTGMDFRSASAILTVRGPPGEPGGLFRGDNAGLDMSEVNPGQRFVRLYWSDGETHGGSILAYTVEFRTEFDMNWRVNPLANGIEARFVQSTEFPDKHTIMLTNVKPYAMHQFRIRAINQYGVGAPSLPLTDVMVGGTFPQVPPPGLTGGGGKVGTLTIKWQPLPREDHGGPNLRYIVNYRAKGNTGALDAGWQPTEPDELTPEQACKVVSDIRKGLISICSHTVKVGNDLYYMPYEARIRAKNSYGDGVWSGIASMMSAEEMPTGTPRNVFSVSYNATALEVYWTPVPNLRSNMKGLLLGYRINYWDRDDEVEDQARFNIIRVPQGMDNIDHGLIIGLVPGRWYVSNVQAFSSAGYGPKSEDYPQETANFAPGLYPTEVHVYSIEGIGVRVNFRGISTLVGEEPLMGYNLQYWPSGENIRKALNKDVGRANYGVITNLTESVLYQLRVFGYSRGGQGKRSSPTVYFTVGSGQVAFNPETTEVMAGGSITQFSLPTLMFALLLSAIIAHLSCH